MKKSISYWSFVGRSAVEAMRIAKDAGFAGIELAMDAAGDLTPETTDAELAALRDAAAEIGIALPSVASGLYWSYSFTSDDPAERQKAHDTAVRELQVAKALGADTILLVPGSVAVEFVPERPVVPYDVVYDRALEALKKLAPIAEELKVNIGVENVWNKFLLSPLEMRDFLDKIGSDCVGSYFDIGNVVYSGYPEHWIRILGKRIKKVHFKDYRCNPGGLNCFVDILSGDVNWPEVKKAFDDIGYDGWVTGEMIPQYTHGSDQIVYNTAGSMDRILRGDF
ncbi:MAG: sugar phosphate isomerase/epimerase [Oscillospiraceae bacterium]|nr:sugar phosphate isomerase/epimerase [Oscillospiraceae bacterium]